MGGSVHTVKRDVQASVVARKENGLEVNADKLSTWSYLEIRTQEKATIQRSIIFPLKAWISSNIWEQA